MMTSWCNRSVASVCEEGGKAEEADFSSRFCKSELYVACTNQKPIFPVIREKGWDSVSVDKECEGIKYMTAASNWVSFLPTDDYGSAIQRLIAGLKGRLGRPLPRQVDDLKKQGMASLEFFYGL